MELTMLWVHGGAIGYGRYGEELAKEMRRIGVDIYDRIDEPVENEAPQPTSPRFLLEQEGNRRHKKTNVAAWISTPGHARGWWDGQHVALSTMWEATNLPESFRESMHNFETIIVPSSQNLELFSRYHRNVHKVPLGVDTETWKYRAREEPTTEFRFLIGGSGKRKGTDLAVKAFRKVFPDGSWGAESPTPVLILKSPKPEDFYGERIRRVPGRISAEEEVSLYASAHCYLQPSRGEGFGLQPLQAMAQGCPTILTDAHGHADFAWLGYGLPYSMSKADYFIYGDAGEWWEPDFDALCEQMRYVYDHYAIARERAEESAWFIQRNWGWEHCARNFLEAVGPDLLCEPYSGSGKWRDAEAKLFRVRVSAPWATDIGDRRMIFDPGVDYYETADVKRIMFEADLLDPDCLGDDDGLTEAQVEKVGAYRAEHAWCPTCQQRLNSGVRRSDMVLADLEREHRPSVTLASMFRDSAPYLPRYFAQVRALRELMDVRCVWAEGDSTDDTYDLLAASGLADTIIKVDHGGDRYGSVDHPKRWQQIGSVMRPLLQAVGDPGDAFIWVESDLVWEPAMLARLVVDLEEVPAVAPLLLANNHRRYYDTWGYRHNGAQFRGDPPYFDGQPPNGLARIDSCGSCFVLRPDWFKDAAENWSGIWPFYIADLHVDVEVEVTHP